MKIAYISPIYFSDVDLSYLAEAQKMMDITYFIPLNSWLLKGAAINIANQLPVNGIIKASEYDELKKFSSIIDLDKTFVVNYCGRSRRSINNVWNSIKLLFFLKKHKFDVIHITEFLAPYQYPLYFLRKKLLLTVHDPFPHSASNCNLPQIIRDRKIGFKLIKNFVLLNKAQRNDFIAAYKIKSQNIYDSILGAYNYLRRYPSTNLVKTYVLFFGQINEHKGVDVLFPAIQKAHEENPEINLICAGKWKYNFDYSHFNKLDYIKIIDRFIPDEELAQLISSSSFVVCPYKDATQSGVVMSAYAFNKPVIATNVGGLQEMVKDGSLGKIVPSNDINALKDAIVNLWEDQSVLNEYSNNIASVYQNGEKAWPHISKGLYDIYSTLYNK